MLSCRSNEQQNASLSMAMRNSLAWPALTAPGSRLALVLLGLCTAILGCFSVPATPISTATHTAVRLPSETALPSASPAPPSSATASPDPAGQIVFTCQISGRSDQNQLCIMQADGSGMRQLTTLEHADHLYPSLSPSGDSLVFSSNQSGGYEIYELPLTTTDEEPRRLTSFGDAYAPAISPDGETIVFTRSDGVWRQLWTMARTGADALPISDPAWGWAWDASWSPAGEALLLASDHSGSTQLFTLHLASGGLEQVSDLNNLRGRNDWSPDGARVSTYQGEAWAREIVEIDLAEGSVRQLTAGGNNLAPSYSPDGEWLAFTSYRDNFRDENGCEIYILHLATGEIRRLTENDYCDWQPRWGRLSSIAE